MQRPARAVMIARRIFSFDLRRGGAPGVSAVGAVFQNKVDVSVVAPGCLASFAPGQQYPILRQEQRRNSIGMVTIISMLIDGGRKRFARRDRHSDDQMRDRRETDHKSPQS